MQNIDSVCVYHHLGLIMGVDVRLMQVHVWYSKTGPHVHTTLQIWDKKKYVYFCLYAYTKFIHMQF